MAALTTKVQDFAQSTDVRWKNTTGSSVNVGAIVAVGSRFGRLFSSDNGNASDSAVAANEYGLVAMGGVFKVPKITGAMAVGDEVVWASALNKVVPAGSEGKGWTVVEAALSGDTTVKVRFNDNIHTYGTSYTAVTGDDNSNFFLFDTALGATPAGVPNVWITNTSGVNRWSQGAIAWQSSSDIGKLKVSDSGLAINEILRFTVDIL